MGMLTIGNTFISGIATWLPASRCCILLARFVRMIRFLKSADVIFLNDQEGPERMLTTYKANIQPAATGTNSFSGWLSLFNS